MREFGLCTLPSSLLRTSARSETWSGSALPKPLTRSILLKCYVFQHFYGNRWAGTRFFTKSLKRRAPTAVARLVFVEMIASETQERCRSTFLGNVCFCANKRLDFIDFWVSLMLILPIRGSISLACVLLSCFTGTHFSDIDRSGVSLATISLTTSAPMQRGARPARPFTHFCKEICLLLSWPCSCGWRSSRCCSGVSLASISHTFGALVFHWLLFR